MRIYLYLLAGITSAIIGWNLGQFLLTDLGVLPQAPEVILFPCIAISLAIGMVMNEIFISNPTRPKLSFRTARIPLLIATGLGLVAGLVAGGISQLLFLPQIPVPAPLIRMLGWLMIGSSVGLAEGLTWWWHSQEAGDPQRFRQRFRTSIVAASVASLAAASLFELLRLLLGNLPASVRSVEDPFGFSLLGLLLGLAFSITNSPSYLAALRAGAGFEYVDLGPQFEDFDPTEGEEQDPPHIDNKVLSFVSSGTREEIEEGMSIRLPATGKVTIGSDAAANIYLPGLPGQVAVLELQRREAILVPERKFARTITINGEPVGTGQRIALKHNYVLTFHPLDEDEGDEPKIYRFVYYNRFLDPQA